MKRGFRTSFLASALGVAMLCPGSAKAQDPVQTELQALKKTVQTQNDEIARLTQEVARLSALLEAGHHAAAPAPAPAAVATPAPAPGTPVTPPPDAVRPAPLNVHVVVKGDSLDKIAKKHGTTVADLLKVNKITDPKKLQIGQQIALPPSADKAPEAPADKPAPPQ